MEVAQSKVFARALGMECSSEKSVARLRFLLLPGENAATKMAFPKDFEEKTAQKNTNPKIIAKSQFF